MFRNLTDLFKIENQAWVGIPTEMRRCWDRYQQESIALAVVLIQTNVSLSSNMAGWSRAAGRTACSKVLGPAVPAALEVYRQESVARSRNVIPDHKQSRTFPNCSDGEDTWTQPSCRGTGCDD